MESQSKESSKPKVWVIGGGPSGLLATRHLKDIAEVHTFEGKSDIGGVWLYTDTTELNAKDLSTNTFYNLYGCLHSSMYKDLQTNIPKSMMTFKDYYMDDSVPHISTHTEYIKYLKGYADRYKLRDYIKLNTTIVEYHIYYY